MFEQLFTYRGVVSRHQNAPLAHERECYLAHRAGQGLAPATVARIARELRVIAETIDLSGYVAISLDDIQAAASRWARRQRRCHRAHGYGWSRSLFISIAADWLQFLGRLQQPHTEVVPFAKLVEDFTAFLHDERGLSPKTISTYAWFIRRFCCWLGAQRDSFETVTVDDVDAFLTVHSQHWCRVSVATAAKALRAFLRYAEQQGSCAIGIAAAIESPRVFRQETLPLGPTWTEVQRLIAQTDTDQPRDIRDRAILMLFSIYGLRSGEVAGLQLDHIEWTTSRLMITRPKQRHSQEYPLTQEIGAAIIRYLTEVRPHCHRREVFLTLRAPFRPLSAGALYHLTRTRLAQLGGTFHRYGPHALRHACAAHLVAKGLSLKEIGDHLGHRSTYATRVYAKVDLNGLREVARFDLGGLL